MAGNELLLAMNPMPAKANVLRRPSPTRLPVGIADNYAHLERIAKSPSTADPLESVFGGGFRSSEK
jgi:hypothetical protein